MIKRTSKKEEQFLTIPHNNNSMSYNSPNKSNALHKNTFTVLRRQKNLVQLPKIVPIHNIIRHRRYLQNGTVDKNTSLNLIGARLQSRISRDKLQCKSPTDTPQVKTQKILIQKQQTRRQMFLEAILRSSGIHSIILEKRQKIKVFIDEGNNSRLVNQLMRRRTNIKIVSSKKDANIVWSQFCDWEQANMGSIFTQVQSKSNEYTIFHIQKLLQQTARTKTQQYDFPVKTQRLKDIVIQDLRIHNHLKNHFQISDKKCLFKNIKRFCKSQKINQRDIIPTTYHIDGDENDLPTQLCDKQNLWIVKPGEDTNRGNGISVEQGRNNILKAIKQLAAFGKSSLVQQYISPLLYKNRKFDIRCYALITSMGGALKAYWYKQGYLRTCSKQFNLDPSNVFGHLTNDAIQKKHRDYGKYQPCNKLSFTDLEIFLKNTDISFDSIQERMKELAYISIKSAEDKLKGEKNMFSFQVFGYDFLIDSKGKVWLIEINTNPCLQFSGSLLSRIIWHMVQNSLAIALDPFLMNLHESYSSWKDKFERIYDDSKFQCII